MNRPLKELIVIAKELRGVYDAYVKAAADGRISTNEALALGGQVLAVLAKHNVTIVELQDILGEIGPLLPLLTR